MEAPITTVYSSYTEAQKRATKKYRENNKDKVNLQRKKYYEERKVKDPSFLEQKRNKAKEYYLKKKSLKDDKSITSPETNIKIEGEEISETKCDTDKEDNKPKKQTKKTKRKDTVEIINSTEPNSNVDLDNEKTDNEKTDNEKTDNEKTDNNTDEEPETKKYTEEELFKFYPNFKEKPKEEAKPDIKEEWIEVKKKERKQKPKTNLKKEDLLSLELKPLEEEVIDIPEILKTPKTPKGRKTKKI
jgi:hypothetical protein